MSILRQLKDIQVQAENLERDHVELSDFDDFGKYSNEIKAYLLSTETDEFVLGLINEIPELDTSQLKGKDRGIFSWIALIASIAGSSIISDHQKKLEAIEIVRTIKGKYASIEFILKNNQ